MTANVKMHAMHAVTKQGCHRWEEYGGEHAAFAIVLVEFLNRTYPDTPSDRCARCGGQETSTDTLPPFGVGDRHAWLHQHCRDPWAEGRRKAAVEALAAMGMLDPACGAPDGSLPTGTLTQRAR
jgi:hypothetical protein